MRTPVTTGTPSAPGEASNPSAATPSWIEQPGLASTDRRSTHSKVVRRHASITSSSSPGRGVQSVIVRRQVLRHADLGRAGSEQVGEHVGVRGAQQVVEPGQEGVAVADLGSASPVPLERGARIGRQGRGVALEQRHLVPVSAQRQGSAQPGHSGPDHHDALLVRPHGD